MIKVKLLIPGMHNFLWELRNYESDRLIDAISVLPGTLMDISEGASNYGGIEVFINHKDQFRIYKGIVELISKEFDTNDDKLVIVVENVRKFLDVGRSLETWLFTTAKNKIEDSIYNHFLIREFS